MKVKIAHLYYDLMNLYGEQGNIIDFTRPDGVKPYIKEYV